MSARFYADPIIAAALAEPDTDVLGELQARTEAAMARLTLHSGDDEPVVEVEIDYAAMNAWLDSQSREWDQDTEAAA